MAFCERNQLFAGDSHALLDETNALIQKEMELEMDFLASRILLQKASSKSKFRSI